MTSADDWAAAFFQSPLAYRPGERFVYNSGATYMLSALLRRVTGQSLTAYLRPRLLEPLGFGERNWETCPKGIEVGGWGFYATTEELARFAQMLLQGGKWQGRQLVPADYLKMATSFQIDNSMNDQPDWRVGYGFQFWRCRHNAFRGDGAFGQYALVMPEQDAVLAITSGLRNMQQVLDLVWQHPAPGDVPGSAARRSGCRRTPCGTDRPADAPGPRNHGARPALAELPAQRQRRRLHPAGV